MIPGAAALPGFLLAVLVWLAPGYALAGWFRGAVPGDRGLRAALALVLAVAVSTLLALAAIALRLPAGRFHLVLAGAAAAAVALEMARRWRGRSGPAPETPAPAPAPGVSPRVVDLLVLGSLVALAAWGLFAGASLRYTSDAPDHVGTLREILSSGAYFPREAFHLDAGDLGFDPRKGLLHPVYAGLSRLAGLDVVDFWMLLPGIALLFPFAAGYAFLRLTGFTAGWSWLGGWMVVLTWSGGPARDVIGISPYPNNLGGTLFWVAAAALLHALGRRDRRSLVLAAAAAFATAAVHPMYLVFLALLYALAGLYAVFQARPAGPALRRLVIAGALTAAPVLPYALYRFGQYAPANPIHTHVQGMLFLTDRLFVADPGLMWRHLGWAGCVAYPILLLVYARRGRWHSGAGPFFFFASTLAMLTLAFNPLVVPFVQKTLTYLVFRSFWFFPPGLAAAVVLPRIVEGLFPEAAAEDARVVVGRPPYDRPETPVKRATRLAGVALLVLAVAGPAVRAVGVWTVPSPYRDGPRDTLAWRDALASVDAASPARAPVMADPVTSHVLPAFTSLKVTTGYDQHSSPNDALARERILRARDVLSPVVPVRDAWRLCREAGASHVLFNRAFRRPAHSEYWMYDRAAVTARLEAFSASPFFTPVAQADGFTLLRVVPDEPADPTGAGAGAPAPTEPLGSRSRVLLERDGVVLLSAGVSPSRLAPGDTLTLALLWTAPSGQLPPEPITATVRLEARERPLVRLGKPGRKLVEAATGVHYRFRRDWIPTANRYPPDRWRAGEAVADTVRVVPDGTLAPGRYEVTVTVNRLPHMPNHRLRDYFGERDLYSGPVVGMVMLEAGEARTAPGAR